MFHIGSQVKYVSHNDHQMWARVCNVYDGACLVRAGYSPGSVALSENVDNSRLTLDPDMSETNAAAAVGLRPR